MSHTQGPWKWWTSNSYRRLSSEATCRDGDVLHATVQRDGHPDVSFPNGGVDGPDARLIAAAPDLLAFAQEFIRVWAGPGPTDSPLEAQARAAIAKAEGK